MLVFHAFWASAVLVVDYGLLVATLQLNRVCRRVCGYTGAGTEKMFFAVLGSGGVGKSAVTLRYVRDFFVKVTSPVFHDGNRYLL